VGGGRSHPRLDAAALQVTVRKNFELTSCRVLESGHGAGVGTAINGHRTWDFGDGQGSGGIGVGELEGGGHRVGFKARETKTLA
jgi:hypothetical protein